MTDVLYNAAEEKSFDNVAEMLKKLSEEEQQYLMILLQGYSAGINAGKQLATNEQNAVS